MSDQALHDLGRKITSKLQEDLEREMKIARHVLDPHEQILLISKIAAGVTGAAVLAALQMRKDGSDAGDGFDYFADAIRLMVGGLKPVYLAVLAQIEAERSGAAA